MSFISKKFFWIIIFLSLGGNTLFPFANMKSDIVIFSPTTVQAKALMPHATPLTPDLKETDHIFIESLSTNATDGARFACLIKRDDQFVVMIDGKEEPPVESVAKGTPLFNADGSRSAYIAYQNSSAWMVTDDKRHGPYDGVDQVVFSPDGRRLTWRAARKGRQLLVEDGRTVAEYQGIKDLQIFSPDSRYLAFLGVEGDRVQVVLNGRVIMKDLKSASEITFSPDSKHLAFAIRKPDGLWYLAKDKKVSKKGYTYIQNLQYSPDAKRFIFVAQMNRGMQMVEGDWESEPYQTVGSPLFSPDSRRLAYGAMLDGVWQVVLDRKKGPKMKQVAALTFSSDSKRFAYSAITEKDKGAMMVHNGHVSPPDTTKHESLGTSNHKNAHTDTEVREYDSVGQPVFSPDSKHLAYRTRWGKAWAVVCDNVPQQRYDLVRVPLFSPDSGTMAYVAVTSKQMRMVTSSREEGHFSPDTLNEGPLFTEIGLPWFSPKGGHMAYKIKDPDGFALVVDNQVMDERFGSLIGDTPIYFTDQGCHTFAVSESPISFFKYTVELN